MKVDKKTARRFAKKVRKDPVTECWLWQGIKNRGYASFSVNGKEVRAHRWIYNQVFGSVPKGYDVHHKCNTKSCVNPYHLEAVTRFENMREAAGRKDNLERRTMLKA